jgi:replicative DNA helicase
MSAAHERPSDPTKALDAELACLGACLLDQAAARRVGADLSADHWTQDRLAVVHDAVRRINARGERVDRLTLYQEITKRPHDGITSEWLVGLEEYCPAPSAITTYIGMVKAATARRKVRAACLRTIEAMETPDASVPEALAHLAEDVGAVDGDADTGRALVPVKLDAALTAWRQENADGRQPARIKTPIAKLNACLGGGFEPGDLAYLASRPGVGKTALASEIARHSAKDGMGVLVISREMAIGRLVRRIIAQASRIPASTVKGGLFADAEYAILTTVYSQLATLPLWLCDQAVSLADITRMVERWAFTPPLGLVIVDYLQLIRAPKEIRDRRLQVEAVSQGLKGLAMTCHLPVLCLSSLSRPEKGANDRRPVLSDLRESGELEHDADVVLFLHRGFQQEETTLIVAKNRDGRVGETTLRFRSEYVAFDQAEGNE